MAAAVIDSCDEIDEIKFSCPNKHHFLSDLSFLVSIIRARCSTPPTGRTV